jgi:hypothetical protein
VVINARCSLRIEAGQRVIVVAGLPVHHYSAEDAVAAAYAICSWWSRASPSKPTWRGFSNAIATPSPQAPARAAITI